MKKPVLGAQLYTVRDYAKNLADLKQTLTKIAKIGYTTVQVSGIGPIAPADVAAAARDAGLAVVATHLGWNRFLNDLDAVIAEHKLWNCRHLAIGGLPEEYFSEAGVRRFIDEAIPVAKRLAKEGMDFSYHNHNHEFIRQGDRTWIEALYQDADPSVIKAELDTYWVQAGGGDPAAWVRKCAGREPLLHLKDMAIAKDRKQTMAEIGNGNLNWTDILKAAEQGGVEYLLVEQDDCGGRDPFESLAISYRFLAKMGYK